MADVKKIATRESYGNTLKELAAEGHEDLVVLDADLAAATKTGMFRKAYPVRHFDCGIAEGNMMGVAAGLSTMGYVPFVSSFAMFAAGRAFEQVRNSIGYPHLNVKIGATHGGISVGEDGASHQCCEDFALMRSIPGMTVICPADDVEARAAVRAAYAMEGPVYLRFGRLAVPVFHDAENYHFEIGKGEQITEGSDIAIIATGLMVNEARMAAEQLAAEGIHARVINIHTIKPLAPRRRAGRVRLLRPGMGSAEVLRSGCCHHLQDCPRNAGQISASPTVSAPPRHLLTRRRFCMPQIFLPNTAGYDMLTEKAEGRIAMLIVDKLAFQEKLSEGEKTLAAYILAHGMEIAKYSTRSLAEVTYTSPPTVLRLCKKLGFTGFDDFKQNFVRELEYLDQQQGKVDFNFPFAENDSPMRVAQNIGELYEEAVKDTMQLLRYEDLHKAVLLLKYHEEIHIFSAGTAINQAESFREKMLKIGKRVVIFNNLNYQRYQACCLSERDLAMIISYSGETAQMLEIARQCKRSGTPILALTSFGEKLEQHRTSTNPILLNLHKENAE